MPRTVSKNPPCQYLRDPAVFATGVNPPTVTIRDNNRQWVVACLIQQRYLHGIRAWWMPQHNTIHRWAKHLDVDEKRISAYYKGHRWLELDTITTLNEHLGPGAEKLWLDVNAYATRAATHPPGPAKPKPLPSSLAGYVSAHDIPSAPWQDPVRLPEDSADFIAVTDRIVTAIEAKHLPPPTKDSILVYAVDHRLPATVTGDQDSVTATIHRDAEAAAFVDQLNDRFTIKATGRLTYEL